MQRISLKWQNLQLTVKRVYDYTFEVTRIYWYDGYYVKVLPDGTKIQNIRSCSVKNDVTIKCKTYHLSRYYEHLVTRYSITVEKKRWKVCCPVLKLLIISIYLAFVSQYKNLITNWPRVADIPRQAEHTASQTWATSDGLKAAKSRINGKTIHRCDRSHISMSFSTILTLPMITKNYDKFLSNSHCVQWHSWKSTLTFFAGIAHKHIGLKIC